MTLTLTAADPTVFTPRVYIVVVITHSISTSSKVYPCPMEVTFDTSHSPIGGQCAPLGQLPFGYNFRHVTTVLSRNSVRTHSHNDIDQYTHEWGSFPDLSHEVRNLCHQSLNDIWTKNSDTGTHSKMLIKRKHHYCLNKQNMCPVIYHELTP